MYAPKDLYLAKTYLRYAASLNHPSAALAYAAILVEEENYDEKEVYAALDIAFRYGTIDDYLQLNYDLIENAFDGKICEKVKELAKKYWHITKSQA